MSRIDESRPFLPVQIAILTVSDTRSAADDKSGDTLAELIARDGHKIAARAIVKDDREAISKQVQAWIADPAVDVVISTGGTGMTGRDVTTEAFEALYEKKIDGFGELFRWLSYQKVGTSTIQSRATDGVCAFGRWRGVVRAEGREHRVEGLVGWAEEFAPLVRR